MVIRHRIWDDRAKFMLYSDQCNHSLTLSHDGYYVQITKDDEYPVMIPFNQEWQNVMLYSGSNDKNDKPIYRCDIVKYEFTWFDWEKPDGQEKQTEERFDVVEFIGTTFQASQSDFGYEGEDMIHLNECEVIGNIFENPNLLETVINQNKRLRMKNNYKCYHQPTTFSTVKDSYVCINCGKKLNK